MAVKRGQILELEIQDMALGGRGLVKVDGMAVFVDQAVAGDLVRARIYKRKRSYAQARTLEILKPSLDRIEPPCSYSGFCGGCKWQFLDYAKQLEYKQQHVAEALVHIALIEGVAVLPTLAAANPFGYRNKMEFSCSDRRWVLPDQMEDETLDRSLALGLHVPGTFDKVIDIHQCLLQPDTGNAILETVRQHIRASHQPVYGIKSNQGFWRFVMLRHSFDRDQWLVNLITAEEDESAVMPLAEKLMTRFPEIRSVVNNINSRKAQIAVGEREIVLTGPGYLVDAIGHYQFQISANSFFQTNTAGAYQLYETAREFADLKGGENVLDLYCGTGTIAIYLSSKASQVVGVEMVESAIADARRNCERNDIANCRFVCGDIRTTLGSVGMNPDVMIIDPPRVGMHKDVVKQVLQMAPPRIVYVSCNPATLARDAALLKEDYRVIKVQPVDMFPHTFHIEAVALLVRK